MAYLTSRLINCLKSPILGNFLPSLATSRLSNTLPKQNPNQYVIPSTEDTAAHKKEYSHIFQNVNKVLSSQDTGRLFAVVQLCGKQFKITSGDIILVEGYWPPTIGDRIRLEKILLVGGNDFTIFGRPILEKGIADVQATIIEKTLTHTKTHFKKKRRKQYMRINFQRSPNTMIRINSVEVCGNVGESKAEPNSLRLF